GGGERERDERADRLAEREKIEALRSHEWNEDQRVLCPLMNPQQLDPRAHPPPGAFQDQGVRVHPHQSRSHGGRHAHRDATASDGPHWKIGALVADVVEATLSESLHEAACLRPGGQILAVARREPSIEETEVLGDSPHVALIAPRGEEHLIARETPLPDQREY